MKKIAIFLRGINVNGIRIKMDELKRVIESMEYTKVKTLLSTGNVIAESLDVELTYKAHKENIENKLNERFGYEAFVIIKTPEQIKNILQEADGNDVADGYHHYILLTNESGLAEELKNLFDACSKELDEQFVVGEYGLYWIVQKGNTLQSDFGSQVLGKKKYKSRLTSRTMATIQKAYKSLLEE